jgi:hypothetical protein
MEGAFLIFSANLFTEANPKPWLWDPNRPGLDIYSKRPIKVIMVVKTEKEFILNVAALGRGERNLSSCYQYYVVL